MSLPSMIMTALAAWHDATRARRWGSQIHSRSDTLGLWGDGIVDSGLANLWSARTWIDADDDELVFLVPALVAAPADAPGGLAARTGRIFAVRVCAEALALSFDRRESGYLNQLHRWDAEGLLGASTAQEILAEGWLDRTPRARAAAPPIRVPTTGLGSLSPDAIVFARQVVAELARFHRDARLPPAQRSPATEAQAMFRSIHSGLNAAYVYPSLASLHEMLAVGAWIGHLLRGRKALLPPSLAEPLAALLTSGGRERETAPLAETLTLHLGPAAMARLERAAGRALHAGGPITVDARPFVTRPHMAADRLFALVAERS